MALAATSPEGTITRSNEPFLITEIDITLTGDGTAVQSGASQGDATAFSHGGPSGRTPFSVVWDVDGDSATGGEITQFWYTVDTTNDEIDAHWTTAAAVANTETVTGKLVCYFIEKASDVGRDAPIGYTAASNTNF